MNSTSESTKNQVSTCTPNKRSFVPQVDIVEANGDIEIHVDLPGANPDSINLSVEAGKLTIDAEVPDRQPADTKYLLREYGVGSFHRSFQLGRSVDTQRTNADYANGVLVVRLPKSEQAKPRRIEVRAN